MLRFTNPYFLWLLFTLLIPVIVHLFNFRKYKIFYFSNTRFLQDLQKRTNKQSQLRKIIILLTRILAIACLVFAFARPYLHNPNAAAMSGNATVVIYIDNSFSMDNTAHRGSLLDEAKLSAAAIVEAYNQDDKFMLITNDFEGKHQQFLTKDEFKNEAERIQTSSITRTLSEITGYAERNLHLQNSTSKHLFLISDYQISTANFSGIKPDTTIQTTVIPLESHQISNIYVDSLWIDAPNFKFGQQVNIHAIVRNMSSADIEKLPVRLYVNKVQKVLATTDIPKNGMAEVVFKYTIDKQRIQEGYVEIIDHPIMFDDRLYFSLLATDKNHVLFLFDKSDNEYFKALFASDSTLIYERLNLKNIQYNTLSEQSLIIIENTNNPANGMVQALTEYVHNGGNLLILPSAEGGNFDNTLNHSLEVSELGKMVVKQLKVSELNLQHPLFMRVFEQYPDNIDLPTVHQYFESSQVLSANKETLIRLENGSTLLSSQKSGDGTVFVMGVYPNDKYTDFQKYAIFVPTIYNMPLASKMNWQPYCIIGSSMGIMLNHMKLPKDEVVKIKNKDAVFIPLVINSAQGIRLQVNEKVETAGNYEVWHADSLLLDISLNYSRLESEMNFLSFDEIQSLIKQYGLKNFYLADLQDKSPTFVQMRINNIGSSLYVWFIIFALLFLLSEILLIRFWRW